MPHIDVPQPQPDDRTIHDADLFDAVDDSHRLELIEAWEAFHPGESLPSGSMLDFLRQLENG